MKWIAATVASLVEHVAAGFAAARASFTSDTEALCRKRRHARIVNSRRS
jgi:hypothetical protein